MKKNGFTMIELLAVILLLAALFVILYPSISKTLNYSKNNAYEVQLDSVLRASYDYTLKHIELLPTGGNSLVITLADLKNDGLINTNVINTKKNEPFSDDVLVRVALSTGTPPSTGFYKIYGSYIYTFDLNEVSSKPVINLSDESLLPQLNGNFTLPVITSITVNGTDRTSYFEEVVVITKDDKVVSSVDTSTFGIYDISYTVKSATYGYASKSIKVSIVDNVLPILTATFDATTTISVSDVKNYNFLDNITCSDNDRCEIIITGVVEEEVGTYTLKYTARDPKGNVSSPIVRIIKVV